MERIITYTYTKDCGYETRNAKIVTYKKSIKVYIETASNVYEFDASTFDEAVSIVVRHGFEDYCDSSISTPISMESVY